LGIAFQLITARKQENSDEKEENGRFHTHNREYSQENANSKLFRRSG
jgi:hypothetical protein